MTTNKQRREAARRHLERQLERRQEREAQRRKVTLILSIVGTLVLVAAIIVTVVALGSGSTSKKQPVAAAKSASTSASPTATPTPTPTKTYPPATGASVTFDGVTVKGAADTAGEPGVTVKAIGNGNPTKIAYKDLVVGKGAVATDSSAVVAQYVGVVYKTGKIFQSSWKLGGPVPFTLGPGNVIDGFTDGIGGTTGVPPMHVGGRRIIVMPAAIAYGASPPSGAGIPANASLVFVVDLTSLGSS